KPQHRFRIALNDSGTRGLQSNSAGVVCFNSDASCGTGLPHNANRSGAVRVDADTVHATPDDTGRIVAESDYSRAVRRFADHSAANRRKRILIRIGAGNSSLSIKTGAAIGG